MKFAAHIFAAIPGIVLAVVLSHHDHMEIGAFLAVAMLLCFAAWAVLGTLWWLLGFAFRQGDE